MRTEDRNPRSLGLDHMDTTQIVRLMNDEERAVLDALDLATLQLAEAADRVRDIHSDGGRIFLLGAGTSGRLAVQEAAELPPTFGVSSDSFVAFIASGPSGGPSAITHSEDDVVAAAAALAAAGCGPHDGVIGLAASGTTPFVLEGMRYARGQGSWTCGIANNAGTPLLSIVELGILLDTGPEVVTGSTRLKAGTAQKVALNRITTAAMVRAGKVISNLMVEVTATNDKLRDRCIRIVSELTGSSRARSETLLRSHDWNIRAAAHAATRQATDPDLET